MEIMKKAAPKRGRRENIMAKAKTNKALLITAIVLTVIALVGLVFSVSMAQAVEGLLHPNDNNEATEGETDAGEQAGRAIASVFVAILVLPIWLLIEVITLALDIPSLVMSSTLFGRLAYDRKMAKRQEQDEASRQTAEAAQTEGEPAVQTAAPAPKRGKGMLIASIVLMVLNMAVIAVLVVTTITVIA